jgi:hypothetical protein
MTRRIVAAIQRALLADPRRRTGAEGQPAACYTKPRLDP